MTTQKMDDYTRQRVADMREKSRFRQRAYDKMIAAGYDPVLVSEAQSVVPTKSEKVDTPTIDEYTRQRVAEMRAKSRFRQRMYEKLIAAGYGPV
jgi:hypothetical protein